MAREPQVQISKSLFAQLLGYFLLDRTDLDESIKKGLNDKLDAIVKHELYTTSKTAPNAEQREQARQEYLEKVGVPESFRW